jgi:hypothetical protein
LCDAGNRTRIRLVIELTRENGESRIARQGLVDADDEESG